MSFFDRLTNRDKEEVELNPDRVHRERSDRVKDRGSEVELQDEADNSSSNSAGSAGGFLPGTGTANPSSASTDETDPFDADDDVKKAIGKVIKQNERIIELLETISQSYDDTGSSGSSSSGSDELW